MQLFYVAILFQPYLTLVKLCQVFTKTDSNSLSTSGSTDSIFPNLNLHKLYN